MKFHIVATFLLLNTAALAQTYESVTRKNFDGSIRTTTTKVNDAYTNPKLYAVDFTAVSHQKEVYSNGETYNLGVAIGKAQAEKKRREEILKRESAQLFIDEDSLIKSGEEYSTVVIEKVKGKNSNNHFNLIIDSIMANKKYKVLNATLKVHDKALSLAKITPRNKKYLYLSCHSKKEGIHTINYLRINNYQGQPIYMVRGKNIALNRMIKPLTSNEVWSYDYFLTSEEKDHKMKLNELKKNKLSVKKSEARKELLELNELYKEGLISESEFEQKKEELKAIILK